MNETKKIKSDNLFPVVGVGASAGGLDVFKKLLKAIPENSGMAYVLVQHLDPKHESLLPGLLQKVTSIPVVEISNDIVVEPDHIYVIPSNKMMVANDGVLKLTNRPAKTKNKLNLPIDIFFSSLAEVHQSHAIGVVLSGNGNDGTMGLKAIKDYGGITFAQDEDSAAFESMPNSAIHAGVVDFILSPEEMPQKILDIHKRINDVPDTAEIVYRQDDDVYKQIISLLRLRKGTDFTYYKQTTIRRRILRRMALNKFEEPEQYLRYLKENKLEQDMLYQDMLIPVTSFFRDDKVFDNLCETVFPLLVKNKTDYNPVRIWVAGCSTGEEAYTIAICMKEFLGDDLEKVQVIATDLSESAIAKARAGIYSKNEINSLPPKYLNDFFTKTVHGYKVNKQIRDMCIFAVHNFLKDPPFGKIDFISCRNVMIYMEPYLQKKALTTFHYSLNPQGFLLLGKSETIASVPELFVAAGKNNKLFTRKDIPGKFQHVASQRIEENLKHKNYSNKNTFITTDFQKIADDIMLNKFAPAGVIVNDAMDIVHFRGNTNDFLEQLPGKPSHNLLKMAKYGLAFELRNLLHKVKKEQVSAKKDNVILQINDQLHNISIEVIPLKNTIEPYYLLVLQDNHTISNEMPVLSTKNSAKSDKKDLRIQQLEHELIQVHEDMRSITEDQEAINEELQNDNEELLSTSEELQSLNEELQTSKEELQSTNEELTVVNQEIVSLNELVSEARDYAEGIVSTMREPLLVLDKDLRIKTANNAYYKSFKVTEFDTIGKLIYELDNEQWNIAELRNLLEKILPEKSSFNDFEIKHKFENIGERILIMNARELMKEKSSEKLILLVIEDNTEIRNKAFELQLKEKELLKKDLHERKKEKIRLEKAVKQRTKELANANNSLVAQNKEKEEKSIELLKVNQQLIVEYIEKEVRAAELVTANKELLYQFNEKEKRAAELIIANKELAFQNEEKARKEEELMIANKELQSFNYISSHDLQEPLRKIQIFAHRILEKEKDNLSETGKDYFGRMQVSANRMQKLIEDLLAFSRLATADRKFEYTDLQIIIADVLADLKESIDEKQAIIECGDHCTANVIPFQFHQLICNLISNSLKFSHPGKPPHITITIFMKDGNTLNHQNKLLKDKLYGDKNYCHVRISDNGIGFEEQYNTRIFEVFQRLHTSLEYKGTGIGLAIVKKIVENHYGIITADSIKNNGATFDIYFPAN